MNAVVITDTGGVDKLKFVKVDVPLPKDGGVLMKVLYCGVNHLDLLIRQGKRIGPKTFPHVLGSEIVGEIVPSDEKVVVYPWTFCGICQQCKLGFENICDNGGTIGRTSWGGYAEYVVVPKRNLIKIPSGVKLESTAASALAGTTAYHLIQRAKIKNGLTVLVTGATGGVGTAVLQLLKNKKCKIICTTSHKSKIPLLKKLGVDKVVSTKNVINEVKKFYPQGVDYAIDIVGGSVWSDVIQTLAKNGTITFCATTLDEPGVVNIGGVFSRQINLLGSYGGTIKDLKAVLDLLEKGILKPTIDTIYPLKEVAKAHLKMENQKMFGKILLKV